MKMESSSEEGARMFLPISIDSMNNRSMLPNGEYQVSCSVYRSQENESFGQLYLYKLTSTHQFLACDLLIQDDLTNVYFVDFAFMPDRLWRDSYGLKGESLVSLLPEEFLGYSKINDYDAGRIILSGV